MREFYGELQHDPDDPPPVETFQDSWWGFGAKAAVKATIANSDDEGLPTAYEQRIFDDKVERTYQWIFEKYPGGAIPDTAD
jgi:hypothetical protein